MARFVEWKVLFSGAVKDELGSYGPRAPKLAPVDATAEKRGTAGSIYVGSKDLFLTANQGDAVDGAAPTDLSWYKSAPIRIPAGGSVGEGVNYSFEKMVAIRFFKDPADTNNTTISNIKVWKNSGALQQGVVLFASLMDREATVTDASALPMLPESSIDVETLAPTGVNGNQTEYANVVAAMKAELPARTVTSGDATSGWKIFASPLFDGTTDLSETKDAGTALEFSTPDLPTQEGAATGWMVDGVDMGKGYPNELLTLVMGVIVGCSQPGDIHDGAQPITIMVEYNEA